MTDRREALSVGCMGEASQCEPYVARFCGERISGRTIGGKRRIEADAVKVFDLSRRSRPVAKADVSTTPLVDDVALAGNREGTASRASRVRRGDKLHQAVAGAGCACDELNPIRIAHRRPGARAADDDEDVACTACRGEFV